MRLKNLFSGFEEKVGENQDLLDVSDIAYHTGQVKGGSCFVALRGLKTDGHKFVKEAIQKGARVVVLEKNMKLPKEIIKVPVEDSRDALARLSANFFGNPTKDLNMVGITGTNGKTTTANLLESIWKAAGLKTGLVTTVEYRWGRVRQAAVRTTPESYDLQKMLRAMLDEKVTDVVMEVTSHAIDLKRVVGCHFDGVIFTNLSEDHLDYHQTMENYFDCKARLFRERLGVSEKTALWAVLNWDDPFGRALAKDLPAKVWRFSLREKTEVTAETLSVDWKGIRLQLASPKGRLALSSPLIGRFNAENILAAVTAAMAMQLPLDAIAAGVASFQGAPGRLEPVSHGHGFQVFVDYAHTPDALKNVLETLKSLKPKRMITLFGCGGNRDKMKRPMMGKIAEALSDLVVLTSDNPRDEKPEDILRDVAKGFENGAAHLQMVDRREAIAKALKEAKPGDCVLIAGKGHETFQEIKGVKRTFDDRAVAKEILNGI